MFNLKKMKFFIICLLVIFNCNDSTGSDTNPETHHHDSVHVYNSAPITIPHNAYTPIAFDSERIDLNDMHDMTNPGRLLAKKTGLYLIIVKLAFAHDPNGSRGIYIMQNNARYIAVEEKYALAFNFTTFNLTTSAYLTENDYVNIRVYQDSGGDLDIVKPGTEKWSPEFMMTLIE